jgi:hypothetical protein
MSLHPPGRVWRRAIAPTTEDASWTIREAAWGFEERVIWPGSDATRGAIERAGRTMQPLQRLIQTRLTWPLGDALRERSGRTRAAIAAGAATLALLAAGGGAMSASHHHSSAYGALQAASVTAAPAGSDAQALQGITPQFKAGHAAPAAPQPPTKTSAPPTQVAWQFAQALVAYEVGQSGKKTETAFNATATKPLAKALAKDPPRLPANGKVPRAQVLNVVIGAAGKEQVTASVSLVRLRAISEVRLTLTKTGDEWRVGQVLG